MAWVKGLSWWTCLRDLGYVLEAGYVHFPSLWVFQILLHEGELEKGTTSRSWFKNQPSTSGSSSYFKWKPGPVSALLLDIQEVPQRIKCSKITVCPQGHLALACVLCDNNLAHAGFMEGDLRQRVLCQPAKATGEGAQTPGVNGIPSRERVPRLESQTAQTSSDLSKSYLFPHL